VEEIEHRAAPACELGDEDHVNFAGLGQRQDFLALGALILGPGSYFFPDPDDFIARLLGEGAQVSLLAAQV
jgi:hypothetical protein